MSRSIPDCPGCGEPLDRVTYPCDSKLNREQWLLTRAGDWWCQTCPANGRGRTGAYYWASELPLQPGDKVWVRLTIRGKPVEPNAHGVVTAVPPDALLVRVDGVLQIVRRAYLWRI